MGAKGAREAREEAASVEIRVMPRASRDAVAGLAGKAVRVRLTAPPLENRANEALVRFLAQTLGLPRSRVEIVAGTKGRNKIVRVSSLSRGEVFARLGLEQPPD